MKNTLLLTIISVLLLAGAVVFAAGFDDRGNPNDPATNERANACYEGGSLAGKCGATDADRDGRIEEWEIEWMWTCGWYLIRFESGMLIRAEVPYTCQALLPLVVIPAAPP